MGLISCAKKYPVSTFHPKNPALQDSILVFNQDCELVSQLPNKYHNIKQKKLQKMFYEKYRHTSGGSDSDKALIIKSKYHGSNHTS